MKARLNYVEINITNVCNYSCTHCQSLNNYAFKGHQRWDIYKDEYKSLSKQIDISTIQIIGGEPTLNPDFGKWVTGISELWPNCILQISTNGSKLDKITPEIYQTLSKHKGTLWITCHDITLYDGFFDFSKTFLDEITSDTYSNIDWKTDYQKSKTDLSVKLQTVSRKLIDKNEVEVILDWSQSFVSSVVELVDRQLTLQYHSDPTQAHDICGFKTCHQFNKGKLYKCPLVSVLPDFLNQFDVRMTDSDKELARSYKPASSTDTNFVEFVEYINNSIPQCKFCPSSYANKHNFIGTEKKIKIIPVS